MVRSTGKWNCGVEDTVLAIEKQLCLDRRYCISDKCSWRMQLLTTVLSVVFFYFTIFPSSILLNQFFCIHCNKKNCLRKTDWPRLLGG